MILSIDSHQMFENYGTDEGLKILKEAGYDAVDYQLCWSKFYDTLLGDNYREYALEEKKILDKHNVICNQAHAPFLQFNFKNFENKIDISDEAYLKIVRSIEVASILSAKYIVIHAIKNFLPDDVDFEEYNFEFYKSLEKYAEKFNIKIAVENLFYRDKKRDYLRGSFGTPEQLCNFVKRLGTKNFTACVDIGHAALVGNEPEDFILGMDKDILGVFHVHDNDYKNDMHFMPCFGRFNWDKITDAIGKKGYEGDFSIEASSFLKNVDKKLFPSALKLSADVGRNLIEKIEKAKIENK